MPLPILKALIGPKPNRYPDSPSNPTPTEWANPTSQDQLWVTSGQPGSPLRKGPAPPGEFIHKDLVQF